MTAMARPMTCLALALASMSLSGCNNEQGRSEHATVTVVLPPLRPSVAQPGFSDPLLSPGQSNS